jgi:hypothetical protein
MDAHGFKELQGTKMTVFCPPNCILFTLPLVRRFLKIIRTFPCFDLLMNISRRLPTSGEVFSFSTFSPAAA